MPKAAMAQIVSAFCAPVPRDLDLLRVSNVVDARWADGHAVFLSTRVDQHVGPA